MNTIEVKQISNQTQLKQQNEAQKKQTITELEERLVREAVNAIKETKQAISAIENKDKEATIKAIERAIGQLDVILARDPDLALVPTDYAIAVVDTAPRQRKSIKDIRKEIKATINSGDFSHARQFLNSLASEIRVTVTNLPLATYPAALKRAVRLIDEDKNESAKGVLQLALATLVLIEEYLPIPILKARTLIQNASTESDRDRAMQLLAGARSQLKLSQDLGYAEGDSEYEELRIELKNLEKQLKTNENTKNAFAKLKTKITSFFQRISKNKKQ